MKITYVFLLRKPLFSITILTKSLQFSETLYNTHIKYDFSHIKISLITLILKLFSNIEQNKFFPPKIGRSFEMQMQHLVLPVN